MSLFRGGRFTLHSGDTSTLKIDCDALSDEDWQSIAAQVSTRFRFGAVIGVPRGGVPFARALEPYVDDTLCGDTLIVDDVLTTGASMEAAKERAASVGRLALCCSQGVRAQSGSTRYSEWTLTRFSR